MNTQFKQTNLPFFQSQNADAEQVKKGFLIRLQEYDIIIDDILGNPMEGSVQHYLLLGKRGSGKSTLLRRLQVEIETNRKLSQTYLAINPAEEQAGIYKLYDLLELTLCEMEERNIRVDWPEEPDDEEYYTRKLFAALHNALRSADKKIIWLLDNIDRIFTNLNDDESLLREFLLNYKDIRIIGASTKMTEHFWSYNRPFYEFFRVMELNPLRREEVRKLLLSWGESLDLPQLKDFLEKRPGQLETVRILTDGLPRTLQFFVNILLAQGDETGYNYLRMLMDDVTPLYQERLNNLPPAQRKIVLHLAFFWESVGAGALAEATKMGNRIVSAQLNQLIEKGIAEKLETGTKNHLYRLSERFFNLWLIFTQGSPREKRRAKYLTVFLESFYDSQELNELAYKHMHAIKEQMIGSDKAILMTKALAQSRYISNSLRDSLINITRRLPGINEELVKMLPPTWRELWDEVSELIIQKEYQKAMRELDMLGGEDGYEKNYFRGLIYSAKKEFKKAEENFMKLEGVMPISNNLAWLYEDWGKPAKAEQYYLRSIDEGNPGGLASAGLFFMRRGKLGLAEKYLEQAKEQEIDGKEILVDLGHIYLRTSRPELAEQCFLQAADNRDAMGFFNLGLLYEGQGKVELAEKYYLEGYNGGHGSSANRLALLYEGQGRIEMAETYYLNAIGLENAEAYYNLGLLYANMEKPELAEKYFLRALDLGVEEAKYSLAVLYYNYNRNQKEVVRIFSGKVEAGANDNLAAGFLAIVKAWSGEFEGLEEILKGIVSTQNDLLEVVLRHLLIHYQTRLVMNLFKDSELGGRLREQLLPLYYVTEQLLGGKNKASARIPPELRKVVNDVLGSIETRQAFYYNRSANSN